MNQQFTLTESRRAEPLGGMGAADVVPPERADDRIDRNATRWVFVATVAFWLAVFAAGRSFFF